MDMVKIIAVPMHREGRKFVAIFFAISLALGFLWMPLFWVGLGLTIWCYYFFRNPVRVVPQDKNIVISPADGIISLIIETVPPPEMGLGDQSLIRISVFMNVFNCHVNRSPISGRVSNITYHHGKFVNASLDKASEHNERNSLIVTSSNGTKVGVTQIAGLITRRIVCFVQNHDKLKAGGRFGLIRFGSRLDVFIPKGYVPAVGIGQTAVAGETVIATSEKIPAIIDFELI